MSRTQFPISEHDQPKTRGNVTKIKRLMEALDDDCSTSEGENVMIIDGEAEMS